MPDQNPSVRDLTPQEVARGLQEGRIVLVDVREPNETALERIPGAVLVPLSAFDPADIPEPAGREVVFSLPLRPPLRDRFAGGAGAGFAYGSHLPAAYWPGKPPGCRPRRDEFEQDCFRRSVLPPF